MRFNGLLLSRGSRGLKWKWRILVKCFDSTKEKYSHLFLVATILISFMHKQCLNYT
jgi:hypothetical protein